jgi:hypothetical protein
MSTQRKALAASLLTAVILLAGAAYFAWPSSNAASAPPPPALEASAASEPFGVFEGRVPCGDYCERIKVRLTLFQDASTFQPTEFQLERIYVGKGDERHIVRGTWRTFPVPNLYGAPAISLDLPRDGTQPPGQAGTYLQLGNVLLELDGLEPRVGDASHSFTLSRTR